MSIGLRYQGVQVLQPGVVSGSLSLRSFVLFPFFFDCGFFVVRFVWCFLTDGGYGVPLFPAFIWSVTSLESAFTAAVFMTSFFFFRLIVWLD